MKSLLKKYVSKRYVNESLIQIRRNYKRQVGGLILLLLATVFPFQNCGRSFQTGNSSDPALSADLNQVITGNGSHILSLVPPTTGGVPDYPRLGGYNLSGTDLYGQPAYLQRLARQHVMLLSYWPRYEYPGQPMSMEQTIQTIKSYNPNAKVFLYINNNEIDPVNADPSKVYYDVYQKVNQMGWWAYQNGASGKIVASAYNASFYEINNTIFTPKDSTGKNLIQWFANYMVSTYYPKVPSVDGFFMDNVFYRPRVSADWNRDGITDDPNNPTVKAWYRAGYRQHFDTIRPLMPGKLQIGNVADLGEENVAYPELDGVMEGGAIEGMIGDENWFAESWGGFAGMLTRYHRIMNRLAAPKLGIFHYMGSATDFQGFRYGLASCLMNDAYFYFQDKNFGYVDVTPFDEYNNNLGQPVQGPSSTPWQKGVYRRDFQNGIAIVNPKMNGAQTVDLGGSFKKILGTQDPSVNNGQIVTSVTLRDREGIILMRVGAGSTGDTVAPSVPSGFAAKVISASQINLSWSASSDTVGVKGYIVYLNDAQLATVTTTSYSHSGLTAGTTYNYRVSAFDAVPNHSAWTNVVSAIPTAIDSQAPSVPAGFVGKAVSGSQIDLSWQASSDNVGVKGYIVYLNDVQLASTTATSFQHTGLVGNTTYNYRVSAFDAVPNHSAWTANPVTVKTYVQAPTVPAGLSAVAASSSQINLSWSPSTDNIGVKGYIVYLNDVQLASTTATSFQHTGLVGNTTYNYRVSAFDAVPNHSAWTANPVTVKTFVAGPQLTVSSTTTNISYQMTYSGSPAFVRFFLDTDKNSSTGYLTNGIGANFLIENGYLYRYSGSAGNWGWTMVKRLTYTNAAGKATCTLLRTDLGSTKAITLFGQIDPPVANTTMTNQTLP